MSDIVVCPACGREFAHQGAEVCSDCLVGFAREAIAEGESAGTSAFAPAELAALEAVARRIEGVEIVERLGHGGMGVVFRARQTRLGRTVALKMLPPSLADQGDLAARFEQEARAMATLTHPQIVTVHDFGIIDGHPYLVMEFVEGPNLRQVLATGKLSPGEALALVPQLCDALQYAHQAGVVHRDIKPENVMLTPDGKIKIADFGLAKLLGRQTRGGLTGSNLVMGTPHYMAPEQWERPRAVDHRADIYAIGVLFYEMLTGELPIGRFEPPSARVQLDVRLDRVVLRALERDPEQRYQRASELARDITRISGAEAATEVAKTEPIRQSLGTQLCIWVPASLAVALTFYGFWIGTRRPADSPPISATHPGGTGGGKRRTPARPLEIRLMAPRAIQQHEAKRKRLEGSAYRVPAGYRWVPVIPGRAIKEVLVELDNDDWAGAVGRVWRHAEQGILWFDMTDAETRKRFAEFTGRHRGRRLAMIVRGQLVSYPEIDGPMDGVGRIPGLSEKMIRSLLASFGTDLTRPASTVDRQRRQNLAAYEALLPTLRSEHADQWVVLAFGRLCGSAGRMEEVLERTRRATAGALHRYVFCVSELPPLIETRRVHGSLRHGDIGTLFPMPAGYKWQLGAGRAQLIGKDGKPMLAMLKIWRVDGGSTEPLPVGATVNTGFKGAVVLDPATAESLGLARFEIPGIIEGAQISPAVRQGTMLGYPARRAWVRLTLEGVWRFPRAIEVTVPFGK